MKSRIAMLLMLAALWTACSKPVGTTITNPLNQKVNELTVEITTPEILQAAASMESFKLMDGETEVPYQLIAEGNQIQSILALVSFTPAEAKFISIVAGQPAEFPKKTHAEISIKEGGDWKWVTKRNGNEQYEYEGGDWKKIASLWVDPKHTDHSFDIRYEGPGWESDKIGYRFYLDWRNAVDIFGKKVDSMVLPQVGLDGFDSYHEMSDWGADIMKVGKALGVGTIAHWANAQANRVALTDSLYSEVTMDGSLQSKITTRYMGWQFDGGKTDLTSQLTINAGSYLTKCELTSSKPVDSLATGIIKMPDTEVLKSADETGDWAYYATFGVQSLNKDNLGLFVFYRKSQLELLTEDKLNHVVVLKPENNQLTYYFGGAWELDSSKMDSIDKLKNLLDQQLALLNAGLIQ
ncbi:DUF4861 family protein [Mangrovibacterium marinum]|uniref:Uncharacterized protein DUF4861 n=1 Tax=Mangrovibacterium marinum TaxID=1639118 RepID=A0A2T5C4Y8_9BACT|nr:DUF4861 family protein [Mangrovibacterium marinum]PTN09938.1 uncharacterized protein DUF4861 [Mangrovibacterium marinum]